MTILSKLYELPSSDFTLLCFDLLKEEYKFSNCYITDGANDQGVDIYAEKNGNKYAIQVKHKFGYTDDKFINEFNKYKSLVTQYDSFIFITSGKISKSIIESLPYKNVIIIEQYKLLDLIEKHKNVTSKYFKKAEENLKRIFKVLSTSSISMVLSIIIGLSSILITTINKEQDRTLNSQIQNVEHALNGIKGLEVYLNEIKKDMIETNTKNELIEQEYIKMQTVKKMITNDKKTLNSIITYTPWYSKVITFLSGLVTGIATSFISSILYDNYKKKRKLKE